MKLLLPLTLLLSLAAAISAPAVAQEPLPRKAPKGDAPAEPAPKPGAAKTVKVSVASTPGGAGVFVRYGTAPDAPERFLGLTPESGAIEVAVEVKGLARLLFFKKGYVGRVEPIELQGGAARLEVRLTKDVPVPFNLSLKPIKPFVKSARETEELYVSVLAQVVRLHVKKSDPFALVDASTKAMVEVLEAVRKRERVLRRELEPSARQRYYGQELDLRAYPALRWTRKVAKDGSGTFKLSAGERALQGTTNQDELDTYLGMHWKVYRFLKDEWDREHLLSHSVLARIAIEGQLSALGDRHTSFLTPDDLSEMDVETSGEFGGVGIVVNQRDGRLTVVAPMDGGPGKKAGILAGDVIVAIEGTPTHRITMKRCVELMRGKVDSPVELTIQRGEEPPRTLTLLRAQVKIKHLSAHMLPGNVGYLRISSFMSDDLSDQVKAAVGELRGEGAKSLVIDLRNNPGGLLPQAHRISDLFVNKGVIVSTHTRLGEGHSLKADPKVAKFRMPIAVLINGGSASASEILAGALQDYGLATVVGERSFGKGSVQRVLELDPYRCGLALTIAIYRLPSKRTPHEQGITPDLEVKLSEEAQLTLMTQTNYSWDDADVAKDAQLMAAMKALKGKAYTPQREPVPAKDASPKQAPK